MAPPIVHDVLRSPGQPLDAATRASMEPRFGHDFSKVRIHADARANESARSVNALAYTVGPQIVFGAGLYQPGAASGQRLLAHELTHVVQQHGQSADGQPLRVGPSTDSYEQEAEHAASATTHEEAFHSAEHASGLIQRQAAGPSSSPAPDPATDPATASPGGTSAVAKPKVCPAPKDMDCSPTKDPVAGGADTLVFPVDSADVDKARPSSSKWPSAKAEIDAAAKSWHSAGGSGNVRVDGFASAEYQCEYNWHLSCRRADAIAAELEKPSDGSPGVPAGNIVLFAHGESDEAGATLAPNRRATISLPAAPPPTPTPTPTPPEPPAAKVCGPDVSSEVKKAWTKARSDFDGLPFTGKLNNCRMLVQPIVKDPVTGKLGLNQDAFDTWGLFQNSAGWTRVPPWHGPCGSPGSKGNVHDPYDPLHEAPDVCSNSVQIGADCWLTGTPNYGLFGIAMRACSDFTEPLVLIPEFSALHDLFSLASVAFLVGAYKLLKGDNIIGPEKWALSTYVGGPGATVSGGNRATCTPTCAGPPPPPFLIVWMPNMPRSAMPLTPPYFP